jgi:hypothetical protein
MQATQPCSPEREDFLAFGGHPGLRAWAAAGTRGRSGTAADLQERSAICGAP